MKNLKIINEKNNELLNFKEISAKAEFEKTPSISEVLKEISLKYSVPEETCVVKRVAGNFGTSKFTLEFRIYPDVKTKDDIESTGKRKKKKKKE